VRRWNRCRRGDLPVVERSGTAQEGARTAQAATRSLAVVSAAAGYVCGAGFLSSAPEPLSIAVGRGTTWLADTMLQRGYGVPVLCGSMSSRASRVPGRPGTHVQSRPPVA
jgi:hypothetical protein